MRCISPGPSPLCQTSCRPDRISPGGVGLGKLARYGHAYKDRIVARLLPPESSAVDLVSREVGVSVATLERWRAAALANGPGGGSQRWTATARLEAVIATATMDEATRSAWCREQGLYPTELEAWNQDAIAGLGGAAQGSLGAAEGMAAEGSLGRPVRSRRGRTGAGSRNSSASCTARTRR